MEQSIQFLFQGCSGYLLRYTLFYTRAHRLRETFNFTHRLRETLVNAGSVCRGRGGIDLPEILHRSKHKLQFLLLSLIFSLAYRANISSCSLMVTH